MNFSQFFRLDMSRLSFWFFRWRFGGVFRMCFNRFCMPGISCYKSRSLSQTTFLPVIDSNLLTIAELFIGFNAIFLRFSRVFYDLPSTLVKFGHVASPPVEIFLFFVLPPVEIFLCMKTQLSQVNHPTT